MATAICMYRFLYFIGRVFQTVVSLADILSISYSKFTRLLSAHFNDFLIIFRILRIGSALSLMCRLRVKIF